MLLKCKTTTNKPLVCLVYVHVQPVPLVAVPELTTLVGDPQVQALSKATTDKQSQEAVRDCFTSLMTNDPNQVRKELALLVKRLSASGKTHPAGIGPGPERSLQV